jgi:hypothetical protein
MGSLFSGRAKGNLNDRLGKAQGASVASSMAHESLREPEVIAQRIKLLSQPHISPLTRYTETLSQRTSEVPYFDPLDGGCQAKVLVLLESPAKLASRPRFVSRDNPVPAQRNLKRFLHDAGLPRRHSVLWNVYPWLPEPTHGERRPLTRHDIDRGIGELPALLGLLPELRVIVLAGRTSQRALPKLERLASPCLILTMPHPSPLAVCVSPDVEAKIVKTLTQAAQVAAQP